MESVTRDLTTINTVLLKKKNGITVRNGMWNVSSASILSAFSHFFVSIKLSPGKELRLHPVEESFEFPVNSSSTDTSGPVSMVSGFLPRSSGSS